MENKEIENDVLDTEPTLESSIELIEFYAENLDLICHESETE